jgi:Raf kinase inhibitor-like YbhB/YbcL family protein
MIVPLATLRSTAAAALAVLALGGCGGSGQSGENAAPSPAARQPSSLYMSSSGFTEGQTLPAEYTCDGAGRSPPLVWNDAPQNTHSFALLVEDADAPKGTFRHWGVYDIPATMHELVAGAAKNGGSGLRQTKNDFGTTGYGPPCPPKGDRPHRYRFRLMALDIAQLPGSPSDAKALLDATDGHVLGSAELTALYGRS